MEFSAFTILLLCNQLIKDDMENLELLSEEELSEIKGGYWYYDESTDKWYWIAEVR